MESRPERRLARRLYSYAFFTDLVPLYPVYALLFADSGLSAAAISSLFVIWSVSTAALEVPSGVLADTVSRRLLLVVSPLFAAAGFALWTLAPGYPAFAAGFVLWGAGGALRSGAEQALVYEELARLGAATAYPRLLGRSRALGTAAVLAATGAAAPLMLAGGYPAAGLAGVASLLLAAAIAARLPEPPRPGAEQPADLEPRPGAEPPADPEPRPGAVLRAGLAEAARRPAVRRWVVFVAVLTGITGYDEYVPLLARSTGIGPPGVALAVLVVTAGAAVGGWLAGRGGHGAGTVLALGAAALAAGALLEHPAGMVLVAAAYGAFEWAMAEADARLQRRTGDAARATVTSVAGSASDAVAVVAFAAYGVASGWVGPGTIFAAAAVPYLLLSLAWRRAGRRRAR